MQKEPRNYGGLAAASTILLIFAILQYGCGLITLVLAALGLISTGEDRQLVAALCGFGMLSTGAILHGLSSACDALRDIARK